MKFPNMIFPAIQSAVEKIKGIPTELNNQARQQRRESEELQNRGLSKTASIEVPMLATDPNKNLFQRATNYLNERNMPGSVLTQAMSDMVRTPGAEAEYKASTGQPLTVKDKFLIEQEATNKMMNIGGMAGTVTKVSNSGLNRAVANIETLLKSDDNVDPLIQEAKKYKSAEEFIQAQDRPDYAMSHRPTEGVRAFDLTEKVDGEQMIPKDMYTQWYGSRGSKSDLESISALKKVKGNPEATVTIYRASPKESFNNGDWVSFSKDYAQQHAKGNNTNVYSKVVKAKDVRWAMDDINEFGYYPENYKSQLTDIWNEAKNNK